MKTKKIWIGRWLLAVAALHTVAGCFFGARVLPQLWERGVFNTVGNDPMSGVIVWFLLFGVVLAILGLAVTDLERHDRFDSARMLGAGMFMLSLAGVVLMPASGFWLVFPPAIALLRRNRFLSGVVSFDSSGRHNPL